MRRLIAEGRHCKPWLAPSLGAQVRRAAKYLMFAQVENDTQCPVTIELKQGALIGMGMTERQRGSDVRRKKSFALPDGQDAWGSRFRLTGHQWF